MSPNDNVDGRPLYAQIRELLVERIRSGQWKPSQLIPNEFEIAAEFGVSQGTARKAMHRARRRGSGIASAGPGYVRGRAYPGARLVPLFQHRRRGRHRRDSRQQGGQCDLTEADAEERRVLGLGPSARVIRIKRTRTRDGAPFMVTITLPEASSRGSRPSRRSTTLSTICSRRNTACWSCAPTDRLSAAAMPALPHSLTRHAAPAQVDRIAFGRCGGQWRVSLCHLDGAHYLARTGLSSRLPLIPEFRAAKYPGPRDKQLVASRRASALLANQPTNRLARTALRTLGLQLVRDLGRELFHALCPLWLEARPQCSANVCDAR